MILGYHLMFSAYGFWLPNDPRGSGSYLVRGEQLLEFGGPTKVAAHEFCARKPHDRQRRWAAKGALDYPPVKFNGLQARAIARGFTNSVERSNITIWACAVMPDHVHLVLAPHRLKIETMASFLKGEATRRLVEEGIHPFQGQKGYKDRVPSCFGRKWWVIYKDNEDALLNAIRYAENNPVRAGYSRQEWKCVVKYPGLYQPTQDETAKETKK
jgi:REP element-mobilizing transposase RayT